MDATPHCRNCSSREFYWRDVSLNGELSAILPTGFFAPRDVRLRICGSCGFMEWFVTPMTLERVKEKFDREP